MNLRNTLIAVSATAAVIAVFTAYDTNLYYASTPLFALAIVLVCASLLDLGIDKKTRDELDSLRKQLNSVEQQQRFKSIEDSLDREAEEIRREIHKEADQLRRELTDYRSSSIRECDEIRDERERSELRIYDRIDQIVKDYNRIEQVVNADYSRKTNHRDAASVNA
jgi:hypothetical protein